MGDEPCLLVRELLQHSPTHMDPQAIRDLCRQVRVRGAREDFDVGHDVRIVGSRMWQRIATMAMETGTRSNDQIE